jgi:hypothetical protein
MAFIWIGSFMEAAKRAKRLRILAKRAFSPDPQNVSSQIQTPGLPTVQHLSCSPEFSP